jgi:hypothetical protein
LQEALDLSFDKLLMIMIIKRQGYKIETNCSVSIILFLSQIYSCRTIHDIQTDSNSCAQLNRLFFSLDNGDVRSFIKCTSIPEMRRRSVSSAWVVQCLILRKLLFVAQRI